MGPSDYTIIRFIPELRDQVLRLQTHLWGGDLAANEEYLEWKYLKNPFNKEILIYLAMYDNDIVGMLGRYATCWEIGGENIKIICLMGADAVVHPDHRRRGIFASLESASLEDLANSDFDYYIALSASNPTDSSARIRGWQGAGILKETCRPVSSSHKLFLSGRRLWGKGAL